MSVYSQQVNNTDISKLQVRYVYVYSQGFGIYELDYGQKWSFGRKELTIQDENGEAIRYKSIIEVLNLMSQYGYVFRDLHDISRKDSITNFYLLEKSSRKAGF